MKNINECIESELGEFLDLLDTMSYAELVAMEKMLEVEQGTLHELRKLYITEISRSMKKFLHTKAVKDRIEGYQDSYVSTFVIEQKIIDRISAVKRFKKTKGIDLSIFKS